MIIKSCYDVGEEKWNDFVKNNKSGWFWHIESLEKKYKVKRSENRIYDVYQTVNRKINPLLQYNYDEPYYLQYRWNCILDLTKHENELLACMDSKCRNEIKTGIARLTADGFSVNISSSTEGLKEFFEIYTQGNRINFEKDFLPYYSNDHKNHFFVITKVKMERRLAVAGLFTLRVWPHILGVNMTRNYKNYKVSRVCLFTDIKHSKQLGCSLFEVGMVMSYEPKDTKSQEYKEWAIGEFKKAFGSTDDLYSTIEGVKYC